MTDRFRRVMMALLLITAFGACRSRSAVQEETVVERGTQSAPTNAESPGASSADWTVLRTARSRAMVRYRPEPSPIPLNEPFSLVVELLSPDGSHPWDVELLEVDGRMPHHRHGMNTSPRVTPLGGGRYRVEGMLFHMPGRWELSFDLTRDGATERAVEVVMLD